MKNLILAAIMSLFSVAYAQDNCVAEAELKVQTYINKNFQEDAKNYASEYVTGESLDSDTADTYKAADGSIRLRYATPMYEVFKIIKKQNGALADLVIVKLTLMTDNETGDFLECAMNNAKHINESEWSNFIDL